MTGSPQGSALLGPLLSDTSTSARFTDESAVRALLEFEAALARAQARSGVIPTSAAEAISRAAAELEPDWRRLGAGSAASGHPVAGLVAQLRAAAGSAADFVHRGATAQDAIDTALTLRLAPVLEDFDRRLCELIAALSAKAKEHRRTVMAGRTRHQQAVPITLGLKAANWLLPLVRHRQRLSELRPRVLLVQLGGPAGTLAGLGRDGLRVLEELGKELQLGVPATPWHTQRDGFAELAGWLGMVSGSLGKIGTDLGLLAQTEVGEVSEGSTGTSSAMPQKRNPVRAETLVALARANAGLVGSMHHSLSLAHERGGIEWTLEWLTLPQMVCQTGAGLRLAGSAIAEMAVDTDRMRANMRLSGRGLLAEAASAALATSMPAAEAAALVRRASLRAGHPGGDLIRSLRKMTQAPVDWDAVGDLRAWLGSSDAFINRALAAAEACLRSHKHNRANYNTPSGGAAKREGRL